MGINRLKKAARRALQKKTFRGENRSGIERKAKTSVPMMNPNCTEEVMLAKSPGSFNKMLISGATALLANQREVPRN